MNDSHIGYDNAIDSHLIVNKRSRWHRMITYQAPSSLLQPLFSASQAITPYLSGTLGPLSSDCIARANPDSHQLIKRVYDDLAHNHPEAGQAYWLTRTWDLLCWQPIYVAFIAIYELHALPDIKNIGQYQQEEFITGYRFATDEYELGTQEVLIAKAGDAIRALTEFYREQMSQWTRIRPGFTNHLLADLVLSVLIGRQHAHPSFRHDMLMHHAKLWLSACHLPDKHLNNINLDERSGLLTLVRTSCCLVYKCESRMVCHNCPRHPDNK